MGGGCLSVQPGLISALQLPEASYTSLGMVFSGQQGEIHKWLQVGLTLLLMCCGALVAGFHVKPVIYKCCFMFR